MSLVLRRTTSQFVPEWDRDKFWDALHRGLSVGSIIEAKGPSDEPARWRWSLIIHAPGMRATDGSEATREAAMVSFRKAFDKEIHRIGDEGWQAHVQHMRMIKATSGPKRY